MKKLIILAFAWSFFVGGTTLATGEVLNNEVSNSQASNEARSWYYTRPNKEATTPEAKTPGWEGGIDLAAYDTYYVGDTAQKEIYLTFDEGYEQGYTARILDILKEKNVPAAFFVTKAYIKQDPDLVRRMVAEGHIVGNHTVRHKSSPKLSPMELTEELAGVEEYFKEITGVELPKYFRPPMGEYSESTLKTAYDAGYATIFWSFAYEDWLTNKQPGAAAAHKKVVGGLHNGAILLLHAVSSSNTEALADIIDSAHALGYEFKTLDNLKGGYGLWNHLQ